MFRAAVIGLLFVGGSCLPPVFEARDYTSWTSVASDGQSRRASVNVPFVNGTGDEDNVFLVRLDLHGDATARGVAQGELLAEEIQEFALRKLPEFYRSMVLDLDLSKLPTWLAAILKVEGAKHAPAAFDRALEAVFERQYAYMPPRLLEEMDGIAEGLCRTIGDSCDLAEWKGMVRRVNMLPELIRMTCTMFGAWGNASASGDLVQLRALDFGSGPFANFTVLLVHRPAAPAQSFASLAFPGMVGVITGVAEAGVGVSEKVWEVSNATLDVQPGTYDGETTVFVIRDVLELATSREEAETYLREANRTWAIFLGLGDASTQKFDVVGYRESDIRIFNPKTISQATSQPTFESLVYVDRHPQPSASTDLPELLTQLWGNLSLSTAREVCQAHATGDLHNAVYDYGLQKMWISIGRIDAQGNYGPDGSAWKAFNRPYINFDLADLWA